MPKTLIFLFFQELSSAVKMMGARLEELKTCNDLIEKHGQALQVSVFFSSEATL